MLPILALATLAAVVPTTSINITYTSDSVYKQDTVISVKETIEQEDGLYTVILEKGHLLGYCIYDSKATEYVDGLKFDGEFVTNYTVYDVDMAVEHTLLVKTVYTDDIAGMLAAAKDGDWSKALSNPLILFQLFYYILAAVSVIVGGFGLVKAKKKKCKTNDEIANEVSKKSEALKEASIQMVKDIVTPVFAKLQRQNQDIIEALVLSQTNSKDARISIINLLKKSASEDMGEVTNNIIKQIESKYAQSNKIKQSAVEVLKDLSDGKLDGKDIDDNDLGGIAI